MADGPRLNRQRADGDGILGVLLGARISEIPRVVRGFHTTNHVVVVGEGTCRVEQSRSRVGRWVARILRMPRSAGDTHVTLTIRRRAFPASQPPSEQWCRSFQGEILASSQTTDGEHLFERIGSLELCYVLEVANERLGFRHIRTRVRLGGLLMPIPRLLSPTVEASVGATPAGDQVDVSVRIIGPILGTLLSYSGHLTPRRVT